METTNINNSNDENFSENAKDSLKTADELMAKEDSLKNVARARAEDTDATIRVEHEQEISANAETALAPKKTIQIIENVLLRSADTSAEAVINSEPMKLVVAETPDKSIEAVEQMDANSEEETAVIIPQITAGTSSVANFNHSKALVSENLNQSIVSATQAEIVPSAALCLEDNETVAAEMLPTSVEAAVSMDINAVSETTTPKQHNEDKLIQAPYIETEIAAKNDSLNTIMPVNLDAAADHCPSGLALLAQYDSDSTNDAEGEESDEEQETNTSKAVPEATTPSQIASTTEALAANDVEMPAISSTDRAPIDINNLVYREAVITVDSDDSSSSSDSDVEYLKEIRHEIDHAIKVETEDENEEVVEDENTNSNSKAKKRNQPRVKGEMLLEDLPPIHDLHITVPEQECIELGKVHSIVDQLLLVSVLPNSVLLDLETVLFLEKGKRVLGEVFDVLGQVADPLYCVRFNSNKQIKEKEIKVGDVVYVAPKTKYTQYIILSSLMQMRGSDASWENDVEPPPRYVDFSDDEQEREARQRHRKRNANSVSQDSDAAAPSTSTSAQHDVHRGRRFKGRGDNSEAASRNQRQIKQEPQQYSQHAGSWHSNYTPHYQVAGSPVHAYGNYMPQQHVRPMYVPNFVNQSSPHFGTFAPPMQMQPPPPPSPMAQMAQPFANMQYSAPPPSRQQFLLNPYAIRPPMLGSNFHAPSAVFPHNQEQPPPPPPGV